MNLEIKTKKKNNLLKRDEICLIVQLNSTPKADELKKKMAEKLGCSEDCIAIKRIKGNFGRKEFDVEANVYENKAALENYEPKPKLKKDGNAEQPKEGN